jgi:hypothetical protein
MLSTRDNLRIGLVDN